MSNRKPVEVSLTQLSRSFVEGERRHQVLDRIDVELYRGESVALRGRSGSGKSTLLNLIAAIDVPDEGEVRVAGIDLTAITERQRTLFRRRHIGFVYQSFNLIPTLSVADNIRFVLELNQVKGREATARIDTLLDAVGLADRGGSFPDILSGGEQQRVAIARALSHRPPLLIADEPTGNLDDATADAVLMLLNRLSNEQETTLIIATHSERIAASCDRRFELHHGKLAEHKAGAETR